MHVNCIPDNYYDEDTCQLLFARLDNFQINYMQNSGENIHQLLHKRWMNIINAFPARYIDQYRAENTQQDRNDWFKRYLEYPTKDMALMPEIL